jgi:hippurate hydrolase
MPRVITLLCVALLSCAPHTVRSESLSESIASDYRQNLESLFRHFHANPELSGVEFETAKRMALELRALGYQVTEGVGGTGVVGVLRNGQGPTVLLRADMDGLPVEERSGLPYASRVRQTARNGKEYPVMHACGHDVHITALVGAARQLASRKTDWSGTLVLVAQPSEEAESGARAMIEDGLYRRFPKPDYALAFHVEADNTAGTIDLPMRTVASSSDSVDIVVHGIGAHGAYPHQGVDPVLVAAQIVVSLQSLVSRSINPLSPGVVTVGSIHGGSKHNIIGEKVELQLTVRADDFETRQKLLEGIKRVANGVARSLGVPEDRLPEVIVADAGANPPTLNDEATALRVHQAFTAHFGEQAMQGRKRQGMGAEDFAYFVLPDYGVKGVYFNVGGTPAEQIGSQASHHTPEFKVAAEASITLGAEALALGAMTLMPQR